MNNKPRVKSSQSRFDMIDELRKLLQEGKVTTQEHICEALEALGYSVNQSKVSRLLRKIGAVKSKNERGRVVYRLPHEPAPPLTSDLLSSLIIGVACNETLIIVYTSPGAAQLIARIIDYHKSELSVLGTIAGDDAIFVSPKSIKKINDSVDAIKQLLM